MTRLVASVAVLPLLLLSLLAGASRAQGLSDAQRKVWGQMQEARELNDLGQMSKIAKKFPEETDGIYDVFEVQLAFSDNIEMWEDLRLVGNALDEATDNNVKRIRTEMLMKLTPEQRKERIDARSRYQGIRANFLQAVQNRQNDVINESLEQLKELAKTFEGYNDAEYEAYCLCVIAEGMKDTDQKLEAVKIYEQVDQLLTKTGFRSWTFHSQVKTARDQLKAEGYDPNAKPGDENLPRGNTATSYSKDELGQKWSEPESLRVYVSDDVPYKFTTPAYSSGENTQVWQDWPLNGNGPADFTDRFQPLGNKVKVSRDGVKLFLSVGEQKKPFELTLSAKPQLVEIKRDVKDIEGNVNTIKYGFMIATGGSQENRYGLSLNASPSATQYQIRYHGATYLKGKVLGQEITVFDDNATGRYGDPARLRDNTNTEQFEFVFNDAIIFGRSKTAAPWSEFMESDGSFFRLKLDPDNLSVVTRKLDVDTGTVKLVYKGAVKPDSVIIEETREFKGAYFAIDKAPIRVPVGLYKLAYGIIRQGNKTSQKSCLILPSGKTVAFRVEKDKEAVVELGEPFSLDFKTEPLDGGGLKVIGKSVIVYGKSGEAYCHFFDEPPIPDKVLMRVKGGNQVGKPAEMKRAVFADYQKDGSAVFQPLDLELPAADGQVYEAQLTVKKCGLLGKDIKSEWHN